MKRHLLLTATAFAAITAFASTSALAQNAEADKQSADTDETSQTAAITSSDGTSSTDGSIVVVGSRIRRDQYNTPDSIQVITRAESTQAGFNSTSEILQSTKVTGGTSQINDLYGGFVVNGGPGVNTVSLRGLGTTRTLVLLNGRRVAPAGSRGAVGAADLNVLPNAVIERIEVLNTGASSIYGSDAVAGVINMVTRSNLNGIEIETQHNLPEVSAGGSRRYAITGGTKFGRLRLLGSFEYFERDALEFGDRDFSSCPTGLYGTNGSDFGEGDYVDPRTGEVRCFPLENGGVTVNTIGTPFFSSGISYAPGVVENLPGAGFVPFCNRFRPNAAVIGGNVSGYECVGGVYFNPGTGQQVAMSLNIRDTFSPSLLKEDLFSPTKNHTAFGQAVLELDALGNAEVYSEFLYARRESNQDGQRQFIIDYPHRSPLVPAGLTYSGTFGAATPTTNGARIGIRVFADYGIYNNRQKVDFTRANGGIRGDLPWDWRYDFFAGRSWSRSEYTTDLILTDRLAQSFAVTQNPNGSFSCTNTANGCVAAPVLSPTVVGGQFPADWFDFVVNPVTGKTAYDETTLAANFDGPLFELPGGKAKMAIGFEYRKAEIDDTPGLDSQNNNLYGFTSSTITRGSDSVWEAFGEIDLPLISDSFIKTLSLNASGRYTEYKSYGGQWTYKFGGLLAPTDWISFRGSYGTSYRAPALFEQFLGRTTGFLGSSTDPCNDVANIVNPLVKEQCLADGLASNFIQTSGVTVVGLGGAEAGLKAETSKALTFGGVIQGKVGGLDLSLSADFFRVKVENGVARLSASQVLSQCYSNPLRTTCRPELISRNAAGALTVVTSYVNISDAFVKGIDFNFRLGADIAGGEFRFNAALTDFINRYNRTFPTDAIVDQIGFISNPKWTGTFDANYTRGKIGVRWTTEWIDGTSSQDYAETFGYDPDVYLLSTKDYFLHSASVTYEATKQLMITGGVRNVFDRDPPQISADWTNLIGNAPLYSGYDVRGRTFFVGVNVKM
jgi:outer membrane receptor protein involved in Fe transport